MIKPTKLQETELQELQNFQSQSEALIAQLGQIGFRKLQLEKDEQYLKQVLENSGSEIIEVQRSEIANRFRCVPSQINYVINTRFTFERGYIVESKRGGGGFIRISKVQIHDQENLLMEVHEQVGTQLSQASAEHIILRLFEASILTSRETRMIITMMHRDTIALAVQERDFVRARMMSALLRAIQSI
jgi:transcriptional regulator CtsR